LSTCLDKYHVMKTYGGVEVKLHASSPSALDSGEWSASCSSLRGSWVGSWACWTWRWRKVSCFCRESNESRSSNPHPVTI